jgi:RNA polymerase sigma-70 factor (ECF subfamily)
VLALAIDRSSTAAAPAELDELTLRRAQLGDQAAFRALVERYHRAVYDLLWRMVERSRGEQRVEELTQETFVRVYRALARFDRNGPARLSTWILTIASRLALNELRRRVPATVPLERAAELEGGSLADAAAERARLAALVREGLAGLGADHRAVLILREYHELSYEEIAAVLEVDEGTVKSRLNRARGALRQALAGKVNDDERP